MAPLPRSGAIFVGTASVHFRLCTTDTEADNRAMSTHPVLSESEFEDAIGDALDQIPAELLDAMDNVVIIPALEPDDGDEPDILGLYEGLPPAERDGHADGLLPDAIRIFQGPLQRACVDREELVREIAVTVVHEIGHHFGIDDARLHELGWG